MAMPETIQDDLTFMSRKALKRIAQSEELGLTDDDFVNLTPDELRDEIRRRRADLGIGVKSNLADLGDTDVGVAPDEPKADEPRRLELHALPVRQLGRDAFLTTIKYRDIGRIDVDSDVQRPESKRRLPEIADYVKGGDGYFSAAVLTVSRTNDDDVSILDDGALIIEPSAKIVVNDGQHRIAGIKRAIAEGLDNERLDDDLPVLIYVDLAQNEQRQLFADINLHAAKPPRAIGLSFDDRKLVVTFAKELVKSTPAFAGHVNFIKTKIGAKDAETFTFATIVDAVSAMFDDLTPETYQERLAEAVEFWSNMGGVLGETWASKESIANTKNSMVALAKLRGFNVDYEKLASLDWRAGGTIDQIGKSAGGSNAAIAAILGELKREVVE